MALSEKLEELLRVEAARLALPCETLSAAVFEREREVVRNELRQRSEPVADALHEAVLGAAFGDEHPYAIGPGGLDADVATIAPADVCGFRARFYAPGRMVLVVSGNFDPVQTRQWVDRHLAALPKRAAASRFPIGPARVDGSERSVALPVDEPAAFVVLDAERFLTPTAELEQLAVDYLDDAVRRWADEDDALGGASVRFGGGQRSRVIVVEFHGADEAALRRAVDRLFANVAEIVDGPSEERETHWDRTAFDARLNHRRATIVARVENLASRARTYADFIQYAASSRVLSRPLNELDGLSRESVTRRLGQIVRRHSSVVIHVKADQSAARRRRAELPSAQLDEDLLLGRVLPGGASAARRPLPAPPPPAASVEVRELMLDNGARVILAPVPESELVDIRVVFRGGWLHALDNSPEAAIASAYLLRRRRGRVLEGPDYYSIRELAGFGGTVTIDAGAESTVFSVRGLSIFDDGLLWQIADLLYDGRHYRDDLERYHARVAERRSDDDDDTRTARERSLALAEAVYGATHPFARREAKRGKPELSSLRGFRRRYYTGANATIIVAGGYTPYDIEPRIRVLFGGLRAGTNAQPIELPRARQRRSQAVFASFDSDARTVSLDLRLALADEVGERAVALELLSEMLRGSLAQLRRRLGATYGLAVGISGEPGPRILQISGEVALDRAAVVLPAIFDELRAMRAGGDALAADFLRARRKLLELALARLVNTSAVASSLMRAVRDGVSVAHGERHAAEIAATTLDDLEQTAAAALRLEGLVVHASGPEAAVRAMYEAAGVGEPEVLD